jgi:hypothetical protein
MFAILSADTDNTFFSYGTALAAAIPPLAGATPG